MHSYTILSALALGVSAVSASTSGHFTLPLEKVPRSLSRRATGSSEVENIEGATDYVTSVKVGGQVLRVLIDTGSSDLWFGSTLLSKAAQANYTQNRLYDPSSSKTWQLQPDLTFNASYDVGEIYTLGAVGTETVELGGLTVTSMAIGAATSIVGPDALDPAWDGVMGMGWGQDQSSIVYTSNGTSVPGGFPTFMQAVQSQLSQPVFTLSLRANYPETISFGFVNSSLYTGSLTKIPIDNTTTYWTTPNVSVSSGSTLLSSPSFTLPMLFDSGGLGTTVDKLTASAYWSLVSGSSQDAQGHWTFPCSTSNLPPITLSILNSDATQLYGNITISGAVLNQTALALDTDATTCLGGLQASANGGFNIGDGFFENYFSVFDQSEPSISFAPYSDVVDTEGSNEANLPTATGAAGEPSPTISIAAASASATHKNAASAVTGSGVGMVGAAVMVVLGLGL